VLTASFIVVLSGPLIGLLLEEPPASLTDVSIDALTYLFTGSLLSPLLGWVLYISIYTWLIEVLIDSFFHVFIDALMEKTVKAMMMATRA